MNTNNTNTTIPTFELKVGIVPNLPSCFSTDPKDGNACIRPTDIYNMKIFAGFGDECSRLGIDCDKLKVTTRSMWVQVWISGFGRDNLTDHGCAGTDLYQFIKDKPCGMRYDRFLPAYLPEEFLNNATEGSAVDTYITEWKGDEKVTVAKIHWVFEQGSCRYSSFGKFNELLEKLITRARAFRRAA